MQDGYHHLKGFDHSPSSSQLCYCPHWSLTHLHLGSSSWTTISPPQLIGLCLHYIHRSLHPPFSPSTVLSIHCSLHHVHCSLHHFTKCTRKLPSTQRPRHVHNSNPQTSCTSGCAIIVRYYVYSFHMLVNIYANAQPAFIMK